MTVTMPHGRGAAALWLGHYADHLLGVAVAAAVAADALGRNGTGGPAGWALSAPWIAWAIALTADVTVHRRRLCERCIAAAPALPEAAVRRWRPALRAFHARRLVLAAMLAALAWFVYAPATGGVHHPWQYAADALAASLLGGQYLTGHQHRRLHPWCPYCRWDDGGGEEVPPDVPVIPRAR